MCEMWNVQRRQIVFISARVVVWVFLQFGERLSSPAQVSATAGQSADSLLHRALELSPWPLVSKP